MNEISIVTMFWFIIKIVIALGLVAIVIFASVLVIAWILKLILDLICYIYNKEEK